LPQIKHMDEEQAVKKKKTIDLTDTEFGKY